MLFSYYIGSPRKICLLHHSTWFGFSTWCDDILSNVRIQQFVKSAKTFFFPFFLFENSSIFLSPPLLDLCKFYWKFSHAFLVRRRERSLLCITFQKLRKEKKMYCNLMDVSHDFCKTQCIFCLKVHFLILGETLQNCLETLVLDQAIWICRETNL